MKKTYISPEILIQKIKLQKMIATSGDPVVQTKDEEADESGEVLARRRNDWEDEEEFEEDW